MVSDRQNLGGYAIFAAVLAAAGLPIYIHAPKFYVDEYGVSLAALGSVLFGLRLLDVVQDPLLGKLAVAVRRFQGMAVGVTLAIMGAAMLGLFAVTPPTNPILWFAVMLTLVFSAFSFLTINFYARGVQKAKTLGAGAGYLRVARWRETGALLGVCVASVMPSVFLALAWPEFVAYATVFALACLIAGIAMHNEWRGATTEPSSGFGIVLKDHISRRLLLIALVNAAPVAVSSTLFLFFVESRLDAPGWEGPLLLLFFVAAAVAAPVWGSVAERVGPKSALLAAMVLAIVAFSFAMMLGSGDTVLFAVICLASGAAVGADLTLLPAVFARRMEQIAPDASKGFALWGFVSKFTLAFAAIALLPILEASGFVSGAENSDAALRTLTLLYAGVPCVLKLVAIGLLVATPIGKE
ncbi:MFS transporter [Marivita geojedonensis]|uniref:Sugar:cation symporter n=1 Tax=Marivita geojedonensis TaxID=1123756 RepID=A0A1X4NL17_9RHOB|nr:MFS transporter [Marivita geojedonensis]OSQ50957.1 sugar:cation symporter [Marivita geojedonensis]PRY80051.1 GPH family glycoside/pentoside/hexuronide:cation symporter [Marivita geojedonensis]